MGIIHMWEKEFLMNIEDGKFMVKATRDAGFV
jgi:hypothetical protein